LGSTFDKEKGNWKPMYGALINTFKSNGFGINYRFREYKKDFNPELGFVSRPNTKRLTINHGWRKTYINHRSIKNISLGNYTMRTWLSSNGYLEFSQSNIYFFLTFKKGIVVGFIGPTYQIDNLYEQWDVSRDISIPDGKYTMWKFHPRFSTGNAFPYSINLECIFGDYYGGDQLTVAGNLNYDFSKFISTEVGVSYNKLKLPSNFSHQGIATLLKNRYYSRFKLSFSSKAFLNSYVQYDSYSNKIGVNIRFRYTPREGTNLYLVYNQNINTERNLNPTELPFFDNQGLIFKFSKTFSK
jgi:hypothetical protein